MTTTLQTATHAERVDALPWEGLRAALDERGFAVTPPLLSPDESRACPRVPSSSSRPASGRQRAAAATTGPARAMA